MKNNFSLISLLAFSFLVGCSQTSATPAPPELSDTPSQIIEAPASVQEKIKIEGPVTFDQFPIPTAKTFSLSGEEALLYNAAVSRCNNQILSSSFSKGSTDLVLLSLNLYDKYQTDDGYTTYIAGYVEHFYYNLGADLSNLDSPSYEYGSAGGFASYTLDEAGNLIDFQEIHDGENTTEAIQRICGPLTKLAAYLNGENDAYSVAPEQIPSMDHNTMVTQYLQYNFAIP